MYGVHKTFDWSLVKKMFDWIEVVEGKGGDVDEGEVRTSSGVVVSSDERVDE